MASASHAHELNSLSSLVKTLTNSQLKDILRNEGLAVSGVKASLQIRIIEFAERTCQAGNTASFDRLRKFIYAAANRPAPALSPPQPSPSRQYPSHSVTQPVSSQPRSLPLSMSMPSRPLPSGPLLFKDSPFYTILEPLTAPVECKVREQTRDNVEMKVVLSENHATRLQDPNLRVMVYCAAESVLNQHTKSDVAFPYQVELKANLDEVKANLRGLKNKPGTTRPADVTDYIRKKAGYPNLIVMTYALTQKKFFAVVNLVQRHPVKQLVAGLKERKTIAKEQVLREMRNRADDSDIVATSSVMSLKCPLSTLRIDVPCRTVLCTHNQCFDASSFLQLQEQAPTWSCPVCSKSSSFESLQIDLYVDDILRSTQPDVEQVVVEPDGRWSNPGDTAAAADGPPAAADDSDDLIEIVGSGSAPAGPSVKQEQPAADNALQQAPTHLGPISPSPADLSPANPPSSNKRAASQVIDLTASDEDEDDSPVPPPKRQAQGAGRPEYRNSHNIALLNGRRYPF